MSDEQQESEPIIENEEDYEFLWSHDSSAESARCDLDILAAEKPTDVTYPFGVRLAAAMKDSWEDPAAQLEITSAVGFRKRY